MLPSIQHFTKSRKVKVLPLEDGSCLVSQTAPFPRLSGNNTSMHSKRYALADSVALLSASWRKAGFDCISCSTTPCSPTNQASVGLDSSSITWARNAELEKAPLLYPFCIFPHAYSKRSRIWLNTETVSVGSKNGAVHFGFYYASSLNTMKRN